MIDIHWLRNVANSGRGAAMTDALHHATDEIERLDAERDAFADKALRFDLDAVSIQQRESDATELFELRGENAALKDRYQRLFDCCAAEDERLRAELDEYKEAARTWENEADRLRSERDNMHDVLLSWDALIAYQFTGSRDAMSALQQCADETQTILGTNELEEGI